MLEQKLESKALLFLMAFIIHLQIYATPSLVSPRSEIQLLNTKSGRTESFVSNGLIYLQINSDPRELAGNPSKNIDVTMRTEDGAQLSPITFKTDRQALFKEASLKTPSNLKVLDTKTFKNVQPNSKVRFIVEGRYEKNSWNFLKIYFVNGDGYITDHLGNRLNKSNFRYYRYSTALFNLHMGAGIIEGIRSINNGHKTISCPEEFADDDIFKLTSSNKVVKQEVKVQAQPRTQSPKKVKNQPIDKKKAEKVVQIKVESKKKIGPTAFEDLIGKRKWFLKTYPSRNKCLNRLRGYERERKDNIWPKDLSIVDRAQKIYELTTKSYNTLMSSPKTKKKDKIKTSFREVHDPHLIHPLLSPELMTCISFQETREKLDPQLMNYSYCEKRWPMESTAYGLGQVTRGLISDLKYIRPFKGKGPVNLVPIVTVDEVNGQEVTENIRAKTLHSLMSEDIDLQMEIMARAMNYKLKQYNLEKKAGNNAEKTLLQAVLKYDADDQRKYKKNVIDRCMPCMKQVKLGLKKPIDCHDLMVDK